jgi:muramoyltetrapeptide carboxypeptidase
VLRPPVLRPGDLVMIISPSGPAPAENVAIGIDLLTSWGLKVEVAPGLLERHWYFAGNDDARLAGVNAALRDPRVRGIICTRGGYGAQRIVDGIDFEAMRADPKVLTGFSDITALQMAFYVRAGVASVHGPMAAWRSERTGPSSVESLRQCLMSTEPVVIRSSPDEPTSAVSSDGASGGRASGVLLGGNLCMLQSSIGTPDMPPLDCAILLLEDVSEPPYKIDRMLTHLERSGALDGLAGVALGQFTDCEDGWPVTSSEVLSERLGRLGVPILGGLPIGHGRDQMSAPIGVPAEIDVEAGTLTVAPAVS